LTRDLLQADMWLLTAVIAGGMCGSHRTRSPTSAGPAQSCRSFAGVWSSEAPNSTGQGHGIKYSFKQEPGSCSIVVPTCNYIAPAQTSYASYDVIHTCERFHGGMVGKLQWMVPYDRLVWASGAIWWRRHDRPWPGLPPTSPPAPPRAPSAVWHRPPYPGGGQGPWRMVIDDLTSQNFECVGGASFSTWPAGIHPVMRSGSNTDPHPMCRVKIPAPEPIRAVTLDYQYVAGYGCKKGCAGATVMKLLATDEHFQLPDGHGHLYKSPPLNQASGDECQWQSSCYKQVHVDAGCKLCTGRHLTFAFENTRHNVQLLLPMVITINEGVGCYARGWATPAVERACANVHSREACSRLNETCAWNSIPVPKEDARTLMELRVLKFVAFLCGLFMSLAMVGKLIKTRKGIKREPPPLPSLLPVVTSVDSGSVEDGEKRQRVDPGNDTGSRVSQQTSPGQQQMQQQQMQQQLQNEVSPADVREPWVCQEGVSDAPLSSTLLRDEPGALNLGETVVGFALTQDEHQEEDIFEQSCFSEELDSSASTHVSPDIDNFWADVGVGQCENGGSGGGGSAAVLNGGAELGGDLIDVNAEPMSMEEERTADAWMQVFCDQTGFLAFSPDGQLSDGFEDLATQGDGIGLVTSGSAAMARRHRRVPTDPKATVVLECSMEGCNYTASQQRHLEAHMAR
jgi:hypothetical protein